MKKVYILMSMIWLSTSVFTQTPQAIKYQAIARNGSGEPLENQPVTVMASILAGNISGNVNYSEIHEVVTNPFGLFDLEIGNGTEVISGSFDDIAWGAGAYFLKIEIDPDGGDDFEMMGISQLLSVPYVRYAEKSKFTSNGIPAMTEEERNAIIDPDVGMQIYNTTSNCLNYFNGTSWFEACGDCTPQPTIPDAGADQIGIGGSSTTLGGNTPAEGTGLWQIVAGSGSSLGDPTSPNSTFYGTSGINYLLTWTISTICESLVDTVAVRFWDCGDLLIDTRDGKNYSTIQIGTQCWMGQNLNTGTRIAGSANASDNAIIEKYCYNDTETNCDIYGGLYQWNEIMGYSATPGIQGICMSGWHVPTDAEITTMENYVNSQEAYKCNSTDNWIAKSLAAKTDWYAATGTCAVGNDLSTNNATGFTALPSGGRGTDGSFSSLIYYGNFWSSTQYDASYAWYRSFGYFYTTLSRGSFFKSIGRSVRCLKDS